MAQYTFQLKLFGYTSVFTESLKNPVRNHYKFCGRMYRTCYD